MQESKEIPMKRLLIATTAVGLCLAAPAFAQSTTDQDQLNKQRANQPSTSAPSSQAAPSSPSSTNQQGSTQSGSQSQQPSPSAQAPSSNQRGQAQNQQSPSGSSSTSAQTPASSSQSSQSATTTQSKDSKKNRAQNKRQPSDSSTSAQAPSGTSQSSGTSDSSRTGRADNRQMQNDRRDSRASRSDRTSASVNVSINDQQRTRIASVISSSRARPVNVNFRISTGIVVPRSVTLYTLPSNIVEIVPEYRGYRYFVTRNEIVIVEPRRKTIVAVLPAGGTARAQSTGERVQFTDQQREVIRKRSSSLRSIETTGSSASYVVEQEIPAAVELQEFPAEIVTEVPVVRTYRYFRQNNDVIVVDPGQRRVIEVIR
jgi:hypothetical protein